MEKGTFNFNAAVAKYKTIVAIERKHEEVLMAIFEDIATAAKCCEFEILRIFEDANECHDVEAYVRDLGYRTDIFTTSRGTGDGLVSEFNLKISWKY